VTNSMRQGFSTRLRKALNEAGYTDSQLKEQAELFAVSAQAVRKWLNAEAVPNSSRAPEIALKLGVRRAWLLDGELPMRSVQLDVKEKTGKYTESAGNELSISADEFRLVKNFRKLPRNLQSSFSATLDGISKELDKKSGKG